MASRTVDKSKMMLRMSDFTLEPKRMLPPINGYEEEPVVTLEQAVEPLYSLIPDVEEMVWTVKQNCQHPTHNLSSDESASIMLYTLEWMPRESSFYFMLNKTLRSLNRKELLPWFLFLRLFIFALSKLPSTEHRIVYRGIKMDVGDEFTEGETFIWWGFSSCSSSVKVLEQFLGQTGPRTIFNIEHDSAKDISENSFYQSENEVLMYPARQFQVVSSFNSGNQLRIIHVKEVQPLFPLIHIPSIPATSTNRSKEIEPSFSAVHISQPSSTKTTYPNKRLRQRIEECDDRLEVDLSEQNLIDEDMEIVVKQVIINKQCEGLNLTGNKITLVGVSIIAKALENNTILKNLYFGDNPVGDRGVRTLTKSLSLNNCKVEFLCLQRTGITDEGAKYLAEMLKTNTMMKRLLLDLNQISDRGVQCFTNVLIHQNTTLVSLHLGNNELISDASVDTVVQMFNHNQTLNELVIKGCNLSGKGKERLRQIAKSKKDFDLRV